jgi:hypothetical protein
MWSELAGLTAIDGILSGTLDGRSGVLFPSAEATDQA